MIFYIVTYKNQHSINKYLGLVERKLFWMVKPIYYHRLNSHIKKIKSGTVIFSDVELLTPSRQKHFTEIYDRLATRADVKILNHPTKTLKRYALHKLLYEQGINKFRSYRLTDNLDQIQFPVFIRFENDHAGNQTDLIDNKSDLDRQLQRFDKSQEVLISEFCDTADGNGIYRKYSAVIIDGQIIPRHLFFGRDWCLKMAGNTEEAYLKEELDYIQTNPHKDILVSIFEMANIDFGRIDYSLKDGKIQVWEINTNPTLMRHGMLQKQSSRYPVHQWFNDEYLKALSNLTATDKPLRRHFANLPIVSVLQVYIHLAVRTIQLLPRFVGAWVKSR